MLRRSARRKLKPGIFKYGSRYEQDSYNSSLGRHVPKIVDERDAYEKKPKVYLDDDGSIDTVLSVNGEQLRYSADMTSQFRNRKTGAFTKKGWKEMEKMARDDYEGMHAYDEV